MIDAFALLIVTSADPLARAAVAVSLMEEVYAAIASLTDQGASAAELSSLREVLLHIRAHRDRMAAAGVQSPWAEPG